jgi:hypothetical protein
MGNSFRQTVAGIFAHQKMNEAVMLSGHIKATMERAEATEGEYLIAAQDTTYYNYSGHKKMSGLGVIQGNVRGLMQHNVLLINSQGIPLGLLDQQYWTREGSKDLPEAEKESRKWLKGLNAINSIASQSTKRIVAVEDREGDVFSFFTAQRCPNVELRFQGVSSSPSGNSQQWQSVQAARGVTSFVRLRRIARTLSEEKPQSV